MKKSLLFLLTVVIVLFFYIFKKKNNGEDDKNNNHTISQNYAVKWNDSLFKYFNEAVDTSITVRDSRGKALKFHQYIKAIFNHEAIIFQDKGTWRLQYLSKSANDSLEKDDHAVDRSTRSYAYRYPDTITNWRKKLDDISHTLNQADYILVQKNKRELHIFKKGKQIAILPIGLGFKPVGNKITDGDGKTPEGLYHLDIKYKRNDGYYKSIWISYPNEQDKARATQLGVKPGKAIMIHGTRPGTKDRRDWTAGCIALKNTDMDTLFKYVANGTLIEIKK